MDAHDKHAKSRRGERENYTYMLIEVLKMRGIVCELSLMINRTQIHTYKLATVSRAKSGYPVLPKRYACDFLREVFHNLRCWGKTSITELINIPNERLFLYICKLAAGVRGRVSI